MVTPIADVDRNLTKLCFEYSVPCVPLHVVSRLVEVPHPGDVVFPRDSWNRYDSGGSARHEYLVIYVVDSRMDLTNDVSSVWYDNRSVPQNSSSLLLPLQYWWDNDHSIFYGQPRQKLCAGSSFIRRLSKLTPRLLLPETPWNSFEKVQSLWSLVKKLLPCAKSKWHCPRLLQTDNVDPTLSCHRDHFTDSGKQRVPLNCDILVCALHNLVLNKAHLN